MLEFASRQHGVVNRRQLLEAGVRSELIERRLAAGRLRRLHRGVYLVGPVVPPLAAEMAAVLACDGAATISHDAAARLWQLSAPVPGRGAAPASNRNGGSRGNDSAFSSESACGAPIHVVMAGRCGRPGIRVHFCDALPDDEVTTFEGIPITTPARTLLDLAAMRDTSQRALERALAEAYALRLTTSDELQMLLARHPRHRGARRLRELLDIEEPPARTRSEAEKLFREIMRKAQIRVPAWNVVVADFELDCWWPEERFAVEIDGYAFHRSRRRYEGDRRRDALLAAAGIQVMRVTWKQIVEEPYAVVARLSKALGAAAARRR